MKKVLHRFLSGAFFAIALLHFPSLSQAQDISDQARAAKVTPDLLKLQINPIGAPQAAIDGFSVNDHTKLQVFDGKVAIEAIASDGNGDALLQQLKELGLSQGIAFKGLVSGYLPIEQIANLKNVTNLTFARSAFKPALNVGAVTSQGDKAIKADVARSTYGVSGVGTKVGVLSDSYNNLGGASAGVASGDLPAAGVQVLLDNPSGGTDEGRAMAELVHDVAPGAAIAFNTANGGQAGFAQGIINLAAAGCKVIVDDVIYFFEPYFQDGIIAQAVDQVVNNGVTYFSAAANQGRASYQAAYVPNSTTISYGARTGTPHVFNGSDIRQTITIPGGGGELFLIFQWDTPFASVSGAPGAQTDMDILVYVNGTYQSTLSGITSNIGGDPVEYIDLVNNGANAGAVEIVLVKRSGPNPTTLKYISYGSDLTIEYDTKSGTAIGHNNSNLGIAVGAAPYYNTPPLNNTLTTAIIEPYSSAGGTPILLNTNGSRINGSVGITRQQPKITSVDGGNTTFFYSDDNDADSFPNFYGTSAAAPHAAAVAALMKEKVPAITPETILSTMESTALDMDDPSTPGFDAGFDFGTGYGFIQADRALQVISNTAPVATANTNQTVTVGVPFSYTVNAFTDAQTPNSLTYTASIVPANNFTFNPVTRLISGTPSTSGVSSVTVTATDPGSLSASTSFTITVNPAPVVVTSLSLTASANPTAILTTGTTTLSATVSGGTAPYSYSFSGPGTLTPSGNSASVSGLTAGVQTFTVVASDATSPTSQTITATVSVTVNAVNLPPVATANANQTATVGTAFSYTVNAFNDETPISLVYTASGLPASLAFNATTRVITGTPSVAGVSSVTVTATDPGSLSASTTFTITVNPAPVVVTSLSLTASASPTAILTTGTTTLSATVLGGTAPYSYTFTGPGTLTPSGNSASVSGLTAGVQTFTVVASDATSPTSQTISASVSVTVTAAPTAPVAPALPNQTATQGTPFSYVVPAFMGTAPIAYSASGLPAGLSFEASSRTISGTPSLTGVSTVVVSASNAVGQSSGQFTLTVSGSATQPTGPATLTITSFNCFSTNGALSSVNFVVGYSNGTFTPPVANLFINGVTITGQLGQTYSFPFDANTGPLPIQDNATRSTYFTWDYRAACAGPVTPPAPTAPVAPGLPNQTATQGTLFSYVVPAFMGTAPIAYSATGLPAGLSFDASSRIISGTPSLTGVSTVVVSASNAVGQSSGQFTITVSASATQPTGPATLTITSFNCFSTNGALSSVNFVVGYSNGTFTPPVANLFINGVTITGQLGQTYSFPFDANTGPLPIQDNATRSTYFTWDYRAACAGPVTPPVPTAPVAPVLPNQTATQGTPFSYVVPAFTGTAPIAYSATGLPAGLSFDASSRIISGTPSLTGVSTVVVSASNAVGQSSGQFTITVSASATQPTGPAALTITNFNCFSINGALSSVNFVVGYSNGTFTPPVANLFINGVTITGQLGQAYTFNFDGNQSFLPIQDQATRSTYFVWNFRQACSQLQSTRIAAQESGAGLQVRVLGNPVSAGLELEVRGAAGGPLELMLSDVQGRRVGQQRIEQAGTTERIRFEVGQQPIGALLLRVTTPTQSQTVRVLKDN